jgi:hypothetical protein
VPGDSPPRGTFIALIAFASHDIWVELSRWTAPGDWSSWQDVLTRGVTAVTYLGLVVGSAVLLFPHVRRGQAAEAGAAAA